MSNLGNKKIFSENLARYMALHEKTRNDICDTLKFKYSTFTDWCNGNKYPRIDKIEMLANYFGIEKSDLIEDYSSKFKNTRPTTINVLGKIAAGIPIDAIENIADQEELDPRIALKGEYFGLIVKGQSMEPRIYENDVVIVRRQSDVESGDIAVVLANGDNATVKKIIKSNNGITLVALNASVYDPTFYSNEDIEKLPVDILGKVIEVRGKLE